ncbi:MAG: hypothetical protein AABW56_02105 [Nanoarchaeota archaeon]
MILINSVSVETIITLEVSLLAIFTLFFGFTGLKKIIKDEFENNIKFVNEFFKKNKGAKDFMFSKMERSYSKTLKLLKELGKTFRSCIYLGLANIVIIILNEYLSIILLEIIILAIFFYQLIGLCINVHRFKKIYELDLQAEFDDAKDLIGAVDKTYNEKNYSIIEDYNKKKERGIIYCLFDDIISVFRFKIK